MALSKKEVERKFIALINSTIEGETGEWDSSDQEGKESFADMRTLLYQIAEHFKVEIPVSKIKEIE